MSRVLRTLNFFTTLAVIAMLATGCGGAQPEPVQAPKKAAIAKHARKAKPRRKKLPELEAQKIVLAIRGNEIELRKCFFRFPSARGRILVSWQVDAEGIVHDPELGPSTIENPNIEQCLLERVSELRFGELEKPASAEWTFVFRLAEPPLDDDRDRKKKKKRNKKDEDRDSDEPGVSIERGSPGWLEPAKIDGVVQYGYPLFARCFRDGIERHDDLKGAMRLRLVIDEQGKVDDVVDRNSDLPDRMVIDCVAESFYSMQFPKPKRGSVHVLYRVVFD
jgi:hypothetical protein